MASIGTCNHTAWWFHGHTSFVFHCWITVQCLCMSLLWHFLWIINQLKQGEDKMKFLNDKITFVLCRTKRLWICKIHQHELGTLKAFSYQFIFTGCGHLYVADGNWKLRYWIGWLLIIPVFVPCHRDVVMHFVPVTVKIHKLWAIPQGWGTSWRNVMCQIRVLMKVCLYMTSR